MTARDILGLAAICRNYVCNFPTNDPAKMAAYLNAKELIK